MCPAPKIKWPSSLKRLNCLGWRLVHILAIFQAYVERVTRSFIMTLNSKALVGALRMVAIAAVTMATPVFAQQGPPVIGQEPPPNAQSPGGPPPGYQPEGATSSASSLRGARARLRAGSSGHRLFTPSFAVGVARDPFSFMCFRRKRSMRLRDAPTAYGYRLHKTTWPAS